MIKNIVNKLFEKFSGDKNLSNKKIIEYLIIAVVFGTIITITANVLWGKDNSSMENKIFAMPKQTKSQQQSNDPNLGLEQKMAQILADIKGVGKVSVLISYVSGPESVLAKDSKYNQTDTKEKDSGGGERAVVQNEQDDKLVFTEEQSGIKKPIVLKQLTSRIMGVVVVAEGADDITVKTNIIKAVEAVAGVPGHRIQVFKKQ